MAGRAIVYDHDGGTLDGSAGYDFDSKTDTPTGHMLCPSHPERLFTAGLPRGMHDPILVWAAGDPCRRRFLRAFRAADPRRRPRVLRAEQGPVRILQVADHQVRSLRQLFLPGGVTARP